MNKIGEHINFGKQRKLDDTEKKVSNYKYDLDLSLIKERFLSGDDVEYIAVDLYVSPSVIWSRIKEMDLHRKTLKRLPLIPKDVMIKEYVENEHTMDEISKILGCTICQVRNSKMEYEIPTNKRKDLEYISKDIIELEYITKNKSLKQVTMTLGVGLPRLKKNMEYHGIKIRPRGKPKKF